ncbi:hypothetical protein ACHAXM_009591 [Skeletonema potamos]
MDDFSIDSKGPYLVFAGADTVIQGSSNQLATDISAKWSIECPSEEEEAATFEDDSALTTKMSVALDAESELCTLTLTASYGSHTKSSSTQVVVANPSTGFVTGEGYITSPLGAYAPDTSMMGPASFGFVSKYKKGKSVPNGNTYFNFQVAGLHFDSTSYNWLVITGSDCAKYKGEGDINGLAGYGFMLTACDNGEPGTDDTFRIKIWDIVSGSTMYDNAMGLGDDSYEGTIISGGNIQIHQGKKSLRGFFHK